MSKEREMVDVLIEKTTSGSVTWEATAAEGEFVTSIPPGISIFIGVLPPEQPDDMAPDILFTVRDKEDRVVFSIRNGMDDLKFPLLQALHELARRSALNIDATIDTILQALKRQP